MTSETSSSSSCSCSSPSSSSPPLVSSSYDFSSTCCSSTSPSSSPVSLSSSSSTGESKRQLRKRARHERYLKMKEMKKEKKRSMRLQKGQVLIPRGDNEEGETYQESSSSCSSSRSSGSSRGTFSSCASTTKEPGRRCLSFSSSSPLSFSLDAERKPSSSFPRQHVVPICQLAGVVINPQEQGCSCSVGCTYTSASLSCASSTSLLSPPSLTSSSSPPTSSSYKNSHLLHSCSHPPIYGTLEKQRDKGEDEEKQEEDLTVQKKEDEERKEKKDLLKEEPYHLHPPSHPHNHNRNQEEKPFLFSRAPQKGQHESSDHTSSSLSSSSSLQTRGLGCSKCPLCRSGCIGILIDCDFESLQTDRELMSLAQQLMYTYGSCKQYNTALWRQQRLQSHTSSRGLDAAPINSSPSISSSLHRHHSSSAEETREETDLPLHEMSLDQKTGDQTAVSSSSPLLLEEEEEEEKRRKKNKIPAGATEHPRDRSMDDRSMKNKEDPSHRLLSSNQRVEKEEEEVERTRTEIREDHVEEKNLPSCRGGVPQTGGGEKKQKEKRLNQETCEVMKYPVVLSMAGVGTKISQHLQRLPGFHNWQCEVYRHPIEHVYHLSSSSASSVSTPSVENEEKMQISHSLTQRAKTETPLQRDETEEGPEKKKKKKRRRERSEGDKLGGENENEEKEEEKKDKDDGEKELSPGERRTEKGLLAKNEDFIYLSGDAEESLESLSPGKTYIIGGLVDRNRYKGKSFMKSQTYNIQTRKLPIVQYLGRDAINGSIILTINQVVDILLSFLETQDWRVTFLKAFPSRKRIDLPLPGEIAITNLGEEEEEEEREEEEGQD